MLRSGISLDHVYTLVMSDERDQAIVKLEEAIARDVVLVTYLRILAHPSLACRKPRLSVDQ